MLHLWSPNDTYDISTHPHETLLDCLRRANIPAYAVLVFDEADNFVSLADELLPDRGYSALAIRNPDMSILLPWYRRVGVDEAVAELFLDGTKPWAPDLVQFSREAGFRFILDRFTNVLERYSAETGQNRFLVALSAGGDSRVVAECAAAYRIAHPDASFQAVIACLSFEEENEHVRAAIDIAAAFHLEHRVYTKAEVARQFGYSGTLDSVATNFRQDFPDDEIEILGTYWVQEFMRLIAAQERCKAIIFGYNQEDAVADRLYQALAGELLDPYPFRPLGEHTIVSPLHQVPKRLIDAMDLDNSRRNYGRRRTSVSPMRSAIYFIAYQICAQYPTLASVFAGNPLRGQDPDAVLRWLSRQ